VLLFAGVMEIVTVFPAWTGASDDHPALGMDGQAGGIYDAIDRHTGGGRRRNTRIR